MSSDIYFDGEKYLTTRKAGYATGLSREYLARLSKKGDLDARLVGDNWYIRESSLKAFADSHGHTYRSQNLSLGGEANYASTPRVAASDARAPEAGVRAGSRVRTPLIATGVVASCMLVAIIIMSSSAVSAPASAQTASVGFIDSISSAVYRAFCPLLGSCAIDSSAEVFAVASTSPVQSAVTPAAVKDVTTAPKATPAPVINQTIIQQPVIERVVEHEVAVSGITQQSLYDQLQQLDNKLSSRMYGLAAQQSTVTSQNYNVTAQTNAINQLSNITITNPTITGGTISGASIAATGITGTVSVSTGGTGTTTLPTYGQLLLGNTAGGYDLVATSSLGILGGGGGASAWGAIIGTLSDQTDLQAALNAKLSLSNWYATTTDALSEGSTNLYFTTNRVAGVIAATTTDALAQGSINKYYSDAFVNNLLNASSTIAKTALANIWNPLQTFANGFFSQASSTIGDGTQAVGLTIFGGATTTANAYFGGNVGIGTQSAQTALDVVGNAYIRNAAGAVGSNDAVEIATDATAPRVSLLQGGRSVGLFSADAPGNMYLKNTAGGATLFYGGSGGNVENARFTNDGFFGIGTSSPWKMLSVAGDIIGTNITATGALAVSGLTTFTSGFLSLASSTIGNGTQAGGLTISGGATTTLAQYIGGGLTVNSSSNSSFLGTGDVYLGNGTLLQGLGGAPDLSVEGYVNINGGLNTGGDARIGGNSATLWTALGGAADLAVGGWVNANSGVITAQGSASSPGFNFNSTNNTGIFATGANSSAGIGFSVKGNEAGRFDTTGYFGIGTTTPSTALSVHRTISASTAQPVLLLSGQYGDSASVPTIDMVSNGNNSLPFARIGWPGQNSGGNLAFSTLNSAGSTLSERMRIDNAGNVGIGVTDFTSSGCNAKFCIGSGHINMDDGYGIAWGGGTARSSISGNKAAGTLQFSAGGTTVATFVSSGNVGIGTTTPGSILSIQGVENVTTATTTRYATGGINLTGGGCFAVNGTCIGGGSDTVVRLGSIQVLTSGTNATYTTPASTSYIVVDVWGGGGSGAYTTSGGNGGTTCFGANATACTTPLLQATGGVAGAYNAGTTGAGGSGSGGDINLTGDAGALDLGSNSSNGGSSPRGGGGGAFGAGASFGGGGAGMRAAAAGGGGGGFSEKFITSPSGTYYYTVGAGGSAPSSGSAGGAGGIVVYEYKTVPTGTDLAETYPVDDQSISAGDIVQVGSTNPITVTRAQSSSASPLVGIISTEPGLVLTDKPGVGSVGQRPVALSGRVPTKVNLEGGPIAMGDRIALSSVPGVGKKAGPFEDSVGIALESFDGAAPTLAGQGMVTVFMNLQQGLDIDNIAFGLLNGTAASSSTATSSSPWSTNSFLGSLFSIVGQWLADASNGITKLFAGEVHAGKLCISDSSGETCVTKAQLDSLLAGAGVSSGSGGTPSENSDGSDPVATSTPPIISISGANLATIAVGTTYSDLGAVITGPTQADTNLGIHTFLDGVEQSGGISLDTSTTGTHTIDYVATNSFGTATSTRTVIIEAPATIATDTASSTPPTPDASVPDTSASSTPPTI